MVRRYVFSAKVDLRIQVYAAPMQKVELPLATMTPLFRISGMPRQFKKAYATWINCPNTYFAALGSTLIRDLLLPYCCGVGHAPVTRSGGSMALGRAAEQFPQHRVHDCTEKYAILRADAALSVLLINYAGEPRCIMLHEDENARVISHNVVNIYNLDTWGSSLLYVGDELARFDLGNANSKYRAWGAHGVSVNSTEYYDFRVPFCFC